MTPSYEMFQVLRGRWDEVGTEVERALHEVLQRFNPSDRTNRFVIGDAVEWILGAAFYAVGEVAIPEGPNKDGFDLVDFRDEFRRRLSVKSSSGGSSPYRITNGLGGAGRGLVDPTVFIGPQLGGLVFVDPELHPEVVKEVKVDTDATTLAVGAIRRHRDSHADCFIAAVIPKNPGTGLETPGRDMLRAIVQSAEGRMYPKLSRLFEASERRARRVSYLEGLRDLRAMRESGELTESQFNAAFEHLTSSEG